MDGRRDERLSAARRERIYRRHVVAARVRSWAGAIIWLVAAIARLFDALPSASFLGITGSTLFLVLLNPPSLWLLRRLPTGRSVRLGSFTISVLEIAAYTSVIHFCGGVEAANLTLIYAALVAYVGVLGRPAWALAVAAFCSLSFSLMVVAEHVGWLSHYPQLAVAMPWRIQVEIVLMSIGLIFVVALLAAHASAQLWKSKARLRESESRLRELVENAAGLLYMAVPGPRPEILFLGGPVESLTGRSAAELRGNRRSLLDLCHPDDKSGVGSRIDLALLDRTDYLVDYRLQHADGSWRWVEERGRGVFDAQGELRYLEGLIVEVAERKSIEKETSLRRVIQQVAREWQLTFDTVESPIFILDPQGRIKRLNRAARDLAGLSFEDCRGRLLTEIDSREPWLAAERLVAETMESRGRGPLHRMAGAGALTWELTATLSPRFAEERMILIMQDATRIVELEDSLSRGEKLAAMGTLVGGVAHEVRNPLFGVSATLDAMRASFEDDEALQPYLQGLRSQVDRMANLMNGLLEYGRSAGVERSVGKIQDVIAKSVVDCRPLAQEVCVDVVQHADLDDLAMSFNREGLASLFGNLISNALQHSPPGGLVEIEAVVGGDGSEQWVECVVRDSGCGFNEEALARACEPFFSRRPGGMGLGLAIVERIVEDHDGRLRIRNRREGGAEVRVRLPVGTRMGIGETAAAGSGVG